MVVLRGGRAAVRGSPPGSHPRWTAAPSTLRHPTVLRNTLNHNYVPGIPRLNVLE